MTQNTSMEQKSEVFNMESTLTLRSEGSGDKDVYYPFQNRNVAHTTSTLGSFFHLLKSALGTGLLAMPAAFKNAGLIPGCIGIVLVAVIATHCVHILVKTSRDICKECRIGSLSYTETCVKVFKHGPMRLRAYTGFVSDGFIGYLVPTCSPLQKHLTSGLRVTSFSFGSLCRLAMLAITAIRHFVDFAMAGVCIGGTSVYVIFIASSLKNILDHFFPEYTYPIEIYCAVLIIPLVILIQVRHLKFLVPFSIFANLCLLLTLIVTYYYIFVDTSNVANVKLVTSVEQWPLFLSTAIFAMEGINVVMPVENEMKKPEHFLGCPGVLIITMSVVSCLYATVGIFGYMKFGDEVLGSITLNLPKDEVLALAAKILVALAVFFTYFLQMYAPMDILWLRLKDRVSQKYHNGGQVLLRILSVILTVILAVAVPDLELLIGLVGAIFFSTLGLLIPAVVQTVHKWERGLGKCSYILWKNSFLLFIYLIVIVSGCFTSITAIIDKFF